MRVFIAVELPESLKKEIANIQKRMKILPDKVKWVNHSSIHITLKFLGEIKEQALNSVFKATHDVARKFEPFVVEVKGTGVFPNPNNPRVIWIGVEEGSDKLAQIVQQLEEELFNRGFPKERKKWVPHLTVGRIKWLTSKEGIRKIIEEEKETQAGKMRVEFISVMQSHLTPKGALYKPLQRFYLKS